jgi:hypothetical protein
MARSLGMLMWSWFRRSDACPVEPADKEWVERRFAWLCGEFGDPRGRPVILPTPEFFPDALTGGPEDVPALLARVAGYMGLAPDFFHVYVYSEAEYRNALAVDERGMVHDTAGCYQSDSGEGGARRRPSIGVEESRLSNPPLLVATLAHEVGHELLLGQGRVSVHEEDHEPLTDLLTVYWGLGILTANATLHEANWTVGYASGWQVGRHGYLSQRQFGYALGVYAHARGEASPAWARHVRPDVLAPLQQGLRHLARR